MGGSFGWDSNGLKNAAIEAAPRADFEAAPSLALGICKSGLYAQEMQKMMLAYRHLPQQDFLSYREQIQVLQAVRTYFKNDSCWRLIHKR